MIAELRKKIDEDGFVKFGEIAEVASDEEKTSVSEELVRLGYERLYIPEENKSIIVFAQHGKTPNEALSWLLEKDLEKLFEIADSPNVRETVWNPKTNIEKILDIDHLHVPIYVTYSLNQTNPNWSPHPGHNEFWLKSMLNVHQDRLDHRGYLFLNDILLSLGLQENRSGQLIGWVAGQKIDANWTLLDGDEIIVRFPTASYILEALGE
jgi:hypothetical protein